MAAAVAGASPAVRLRIPALSADAVGFSTWSGAAAATTAAGSSPSAGASAASDPAQAAVAPAASKAGIHRTIIGSVRIACLSKMLFIVFNEGIACGLSGQAGWRGSERGFARPVVGRLIEAAFLLLVSSIQAMPARPLVDRRKTADLSPRPHLRAWKIRFAVASESQGRGQKSLRQAKIEAVKYGKW